MKASRSGGDDDAPLAPTNPEPELLQDRVDRFGLDGEAKGRRAAGWVSIPGALGDALVAIRDLWQQFPKALRWEEHTSRATADFWPPEAGELKFYPGWAKTHELFLGFPADDWNRTVLLAGFRTPLRLCPTPAAYLTSDAVDPFTEPDWKRWPLYECAVGDAYAREMAARYYGEIDYGDRYLTSEERYQNGYHASDHEWLIHYQRTGDERFFRLGRAIVRHRMDIDVLHWPPKDAGRCHAEYNEDHWTPGSQIKAWIGGLVEYTLMTGDWRAREVVEECGGWLAGNPAFTNERAVEMTLRVARWMHEVCVGPTGILYYTGREDERFSPDKKAFRGQSWAQNRPYIGATGEVTTPTARAVLLGGDRDLLRHTGHMLDCWLHYYWGGGRGGYQGCPLAIHAMTSIGLTEADTAQAPPGVDADRAVDRVREYVADPTDEDDVVPNLIPELGRFLLNAGQTERGLQVFSEFARTHAGRAIEGSLQDPGPGSKEMEYLHEYLGGLRSVCTVYDLVEARLAAASGRIEQAEGALMRLIARYPDADPDDSLSQGHYRVAAAHWQLAEILAADGLAEKAEVHWKKANRYTGIRFGQDGGGAGN